jgi:cytochrome c oxidase subunit I+III
MIVLLSTAAALYLSFVFSYFYLWTVSPQSWADPALQPATVWPLASGLLLAASSALLAAARLTFDRSDSKAVFCLIIIGAAAALVLALAAEAQAHWSTGLRPSQSAYAAMIYMNAVLQAQLAAAVVVMAGFAIARRLANRLDPEQPAAFDTLRLLLHYTVGQALAGIALVHGVPHLLT